MHGTESNSGDPDKSLKATVETYLDLIEGELDWFWDGGAVTEASRIDATLNSQNNVQWISEIEFATMGNLYWQDERIRLGYLRQAENSVPYSLPLASAGPYRMPWRGHQGTYPSVLFMYADMEDLSIFGTNGDLPNLLPETGASGTPSQPGETGSEPDAGGGVVDTNAHGFDGDYSEVAIDGVQVFGLLPVWHNNSSFAAVFDGNPSTYYDYYNETESFVGVDQARRVWSQPSFLRPEPILPRG